MNIVIRASSFIALSFAVAGVAVAQEPPAPAQISAPSAQTPVPADRAAHAPPAKSVQAEAGEPRADATSSGAPESGVGTVAGANPAPGAGASNAHQQARHAEAGSGKKSPGAVDKLTLGTATVTGDREQPKVMYIVPWKKSDIGDLAAKPMNSLVDEILAPVDRDVFKREVTYYQAVQADASQNGASPGPQQVEK